MFHKTVKNKENKIKIVDSCGCEIWAKALVKKLMERVNLKTDEVEICDMTYKHIELCAEVWDDTLPPETEGDVPGGWVQKSYSIRYYEDAKKPLRLLMSYRFYENEHVLVEEILPNGKTCRYWSPIYLDQGAYRIFGHWCLPALMRVSD